MLWPSDRLTDGPTDGHKSKHTQKYARTDTHMHSMSISHWHDQQTKTHWLTDGRTNGQTNEQTDQWMEGRKHPLTGMQHTSIKRKCTKSDIKVWRKRGRKRMKGIEKWEKSQGQIWEGPKMEKNKRVVEEKVCVLLFSCSTMDDDTTIALWFWRTMNWDVSTWQLAHSFALLTHSLALHCSLCSRALLCSAALIRSLACSLTPRV